MSGKLFADGGSQLWKIEVQSSGVTEVQQSEKPLNFSIFEADVSHPQTARHCYALIARTALQCVGAGRARAACSMHLSWVGCVMRVVDLSSSDTDVSHLQTARHRHALTACTSLQCVGADRNHAACSTRIF